MFLFRIGLFSLVMVYIHYVETGISPVHDFRNKLPTDKLTISSNKGLQRLANSILKSTSNVTQNPVMEEKLFQLSKDLVSAIIMKLEVQDKITRITREALDAPGKLKGMSAIETRRILDYISKTLSSNILKITKNSVEPQLHRLVYGLAQVAAEVSIVSALKDVTYALALSKKQSSELSLRKKRSVLLEKVRPPSTDNPLKLTESIPVNSVVALLVNNASRTLDKTPDSGPPSPYSVLSNDKNKVLHVIPNDKEVGVTDLKQFLNKTAIDIEDQAASNTSSALLIDAKLNSTQYVTADSQTMEIHENDPLAHSDSKNNDFVIDPDVAAEIEIVQPEIEDEELNEKRNKKKLERLELRAKKAILHAGDVAFLTASTVVAMRRALTASIEVKMSVQYAKTGMTNHQDLMMNLARTAAQQAGREAKIATSKSLACDNYIKLALKYTAQSKGAQLNHVATRIIMETLSLGTLAKSMATVSSDIAINSLYAATDIKPPS
ncbi:uncharacterized protein LOC121737185 isoform X1 [Aricia agestis]|uniref:uncharacterized protein LOC121737185 isoform X1 n=1 Tax=Aricia agestis TaxID=91739 RepID=UPI001C203737|nr:uncharacterized protein LOC121737185 isoform X1 [Aricia agestis]